MRILISLLAAGALLAPLLAQEKTYPYRWVFVMKRLGSDADVEQVRQIASTAAEHGLNGLVLSAGLDRLERQPPEFVERVKKARQILQQQRLELIPQIFSAGYGGSVLAFDKNLAEGIPVTGALFVVRNGEARLQPDHDVAFANGGFEERQGDKLAGFTSQDQPGAVSFVDTSAFHSGKASLRLEGFPGGARGAARVAQELSVRPRRQYRITCWVRTESLEPAGAFRIQVLGPEGRNVAPWQFNLPATSDWRKLTMGFNSLSYEKLRISIGVSGGKGGKLWLDDLGIEEVGLVNVLRRAGTPVTVRNEGTGAVYEEGRDYAPISDPQLNFRYDHDGEPIRLLPGTRVKHGQRLRVDYHHGMAVNRGQVTVCMSEPKLYAIWREQAQRLHALLGPKKYLLSMDEIRAGGSDLACKQRKMTMAEILGDCFTKQFAMLRELNPQAEIFTWSDMLDPNHNARGNYYLVDGDYTGSWKLAPRDLRIMCWYYQKRKESLGFFSSQGFKTMAGAYYDGDTLENPKGWLEELHATPGALGIMYTTWENKYELLAPFGDLVRPRR